MTSSSQSSAHCLRAGKLGEDLAAAHLQQLGYQIIVRNFRAAGGEIDIVAWEGSILCFVEVRCRGDAEHGLPLETIGKHKVAAVVRAAKAFVAQWQGPLPQMRFDAVGILLARPPQIELRREAFEA